MKQFVIGGINLLKMFMEWIGEKVKDVWRGRRMKFSERENIIAKTLFEWHD